MRTLFPKMHRERITEEVVKDAVATLGVTVIRLENWPGFQKTMFAERDQWQEAIKKRREERGTYRHDRQTLAEAEVVLAVAGVRNGKLKPWGRTSDVRFASHTRVIEGLAGVRGRIGVLPEGLYQCALGSRPLETGSAEGIFLLLAFECAQQGVEFVRQDVILRRFSGVVQAAKLDLDRLLRSHSEALAAKYGPDPSRAFADLQDLDFPFAAAMAAADAADHWKARAEDEGRRRSDAEKTARLSEDEKRELGRFRQRQAEKRRKEKRRQARIQSEGGRGTPKKGDRPPKPDPD
jgi:hypothetical protein